MKEKKKIKLRSILSRLPLFYSFSLKVTKTSTLIKVEIII